MKESLGMRKGAWCKEEDELLRACIHRYGEGKWHLVPQRSGLNRCRKSCRLRWLNYLKPNIKRGEFAEDEIDMLIRMHKLLGNRWTLIAGRLPGRTANDVKNFWNTYICKKEESSQKDEKNQKPKETTRTHVVIKPQTRTFSKNSPGKLPIAISNQHEIANNSSSFPPSSSSRIPVVSAASASPESQRNWWEALMVDPGIEGDITYCLSGPDSNFINDLCDDDGEFTGMPREDNEFLLEDVCDWSNFLPLETNPLFGSLS